MLKELRDVYSTQFQRLGIILFILLNTCTVQANEAEVIRYEIGPPIYINSEKEAFEFKRYCNSLNSNTLKARNAVIGELKEIGQNLADEYKNLSVYESEMNFVFVYDKNSASTRGFRLTPTASTLATPVCIVKESTELSKSNDDTVTVRFSSNGNPSANQVDENRKQIAGELVHALKDAEANDISYLITKLFSCTTEGNQYCLDGLLKLYLDGESEFADPITALRVLKSQGMEDSEQAKTLLNTWMFNQEELQEIVSHKGATISNVPQAPPQKKRTYFVATKQKQMVSMRVNNGHISLGLNDCIYGTEFVDEKPARNRNQVTACIRERIIEYSEYWHSNVLTGDELNAHVASALRVFDSCPLPSTQNYLNSAKIAKTLDGCVEKHFKDVEVEITAEIEKAIPEVYSTDFAVHCLQPKTFIDSKTNVKKLRVKNLCDRDIKVSVCWNHQDAIYDCRQTPDGPHSAGSYTIRANDERIYHKSDIKLAGSDMSGFGAGYFKAIACFSPDIPINWDNYGASNTFNCWSQSQD